MTYDLLIRNARIWSEGALLPGVDAVMVRDGEIVAIDRGGALADSATPVLDAAGATLTPGLCDAHIHLVAWARAREEARLEGLGSRQAVLDAVAAYIDRHPDQDPIVGRGWAAEEWEASPDRASLDAVSRGRAVLLHSKDFHALWVNGVALERAGVGRTTADPPGGILERLAGGDPSGVAREHAVRMFQSLIPAADPELDRVRVRRAMAALNAAGVTSVHDFEGEEEAAVLRGVAHAGGAGVRVLMHLSAAAFDAARVAGRHSGLGDDWFRWGALKLFADGTLGSRTAAMIEPFDDRGGTGLELMAPAELRGLVRRAFEAGWSVAVHAIGDRAVRNVLDAFEAAGRQAPVLAPRIEHAQLVDPADLQRFAALGIAASMQPSHCTSDIPLVERAWKTRAARSYPWRSLLEGGAVLAFGSDAPVEEPDPAAGLFAALTRQRPGTPGSFVPEQRLTLDQALSAYTEAPARLAGMWPRIGRVAPGSRADLVVWNLDLGRASGEEIATARPRWTLLDGERVFDADAGTVESGTPCSRERVA
jgi:predicted amidohydrolase YtcJ